MNCRKICGKDEYHRFLETPNGLLAVSKNKIAEANQVGANSKELLAILTLVQEQEVKLGDVNTIPEPANKSKSYL
ncbi:MAG: hypothetical protein LBO62_05165, partial [Endomicrobium sp.]|nr:hypothetical protein [Endomicrobium sp.]